LEVLTAQRRSTLHLLFLTSVRYFISIIIVYYATQVAHRYIRTTLKPLSINQSIIGF